MRAALVDTSRWQGSVDAAAIKAAGFVGVIARCTIGMVLDNRYHATQERCKDEGLMFGGYHVLWPDNKDPEGEAEFHADNLGDVNLDVQDVELNHGLSKRVVVDQAYDWFIKMEELRPDLKKIAYSGSWWWTVNQGPLEEEYDYWEAEYTRSSPRGGIDKSWAPTGDPASLPPGWDDWKFWQWTSGGKPIGVQSESLDYNIFNGTEGELRLYLEIDPPPPIVGEKIPFEGDTFAGVIDVGLKGDGL